MARPPATRSRTRPNRWIRPSIAQLHAYTPGEQPRIPDLLKLNTNENPYPPAPGVLAAVRRATDSRLRLYPDPKAAALRQALAAFHGTTADRVIVGNGSDELLALATRAFVEPIAARAKLPRSRTCVQYFAPSYSLYPVLTAIHGARNCPVALDDSFDLPNPKALRSCPDFDSDAALTFVTTPNAPSGRGYGTAQLRALCRVLRGVVVLDEAYVDFAAEHAIELAREFPHVLVARTFSKAYSLCFQRVGYLVGHPALIDALDRIRDSYNVNGLGQIAALATLDHLDYYRDRQRRVVETRTWLVDQLDALGFVTRPSQTNFVLTRPPGPPAQVWLDRLRDCKILVRWFADPRVSDSLRITIGTPSQMRTLVRVVERLLD